MFLPERARRARVGSHILRASPENVDHAAGMANGEGLGVRMGQLLGALYRIGCNLRCLVDGTQMPQGPAQVAQRSRANILAVLVLQRSSVLGVVERSGLLEMRQCGGG